MIRLPSMFALAAALAMPVGAARAAEARACLDAAGTRAAIVEFKLESPISAQRAAVQKAGGGEFLRSRLCRWNEVYIYEISLLPRDGRVTQVYVRATDGRIVGKNGE